VFDDIERRVSPLAGRLLASRGGPGTPAARTAPAGRSADGGETARDVTPTRA